MSHARTACMFFHPRVQAYFSVGGLEYPNLPGLIEDSATWIDNISVSWVVKRGRNMMMGKLSIDDK